MAKKKAAAKKSMSKAKAMSKTAAIREALKTSADGSPTEVAKTLNAKGIKVSAAYVSTIKASDKRKALSGSPVRRSGRPVGSGKNGVGQVPVGDLKEASSLLLKAVDLVLKSGPKEARELVGMAEQMVDKVGHQA